MKNNYLRLRNEEVRCVLVHSRGRILPEMADPLALFAQKILRKRGVEIILNDRLVAATSEKAILKSGLEIPSKTIISTVPATAPPVSGEARLRQGQEQAAGQHHSRAARV